MPRKKTDEGHARGGDQAAIAMASLLPLHAATTLDWLVDATSAAAERLLNAAYCFVYVDDQDRRLRRRAPASDLRRRSLQRALDAFGAEAVPARLDPADAPAIAAALDAHAPAVAQAPELLRGIADGAAAGAAQRQLGVECLGVAPLESGGERIGALLLMFVGRPDAEHVRLFAEHVACAAVNLRQSQAAREQGVIDVARAVFDVRKLESDLQKELARAERYNREVSIAVIEATNLRLLHERFGAFLTDRLLQRLGGALARNARDIDVIGAYKESGYTMILTEASVEGAGAAARRLLDIAESTGLDGEPVPGLELHLVCGWATAPADGTTAGALFAAAERRMYDPEQQVA